MSSRDTGANIGEKVEVAKWGGRGGDFNIRRVKKSFGVVSLRGVACCEGWGGGWCGEGLNFYFQGCNGVIDSGLTVVDN